MLEAFGCGCIIAGDSMTTLGQRTAKPPRSPFGNLTAVVRIGATKCGSAIWRLACTCGKEVEADAPAVKRGAAHCSDCNPTFFDLEAKRILAVLPATIGQIIKRTGLTLQQVRYRLRKMKPTMCHTGKWRRSRAQGAYQPLIVAGPGEDAPCPLKPRTGAQTNRRYRHRVQMAIKKARLGGGDDRYARHVSRKEADITVANTRTAPQTWLSALMQ